jgi:hypothetical protein
MLPLLVAGSVKVRTFLKLLLGMERSEKVLHLPEVSNRGPFLSFINAFCMLRNLCPTHIQCSPLRSAVVEVPAFALWSDLG